MRTKLTNNRKARICTPQPDSIKGLLSISRINGRCCEPNAVERTHLEVLEGAGNQPGVILTGSGIPARTRSTVESKSAANRITESNWLVCRLLVDGPARGYR